MLLTRRTFLRSISLAALGMPAILRGETNSPSTQRKELKMEIKKVGSQPSSRGPADWFIGTVRIDPVCQAHDPARACGSSATIEPGTRTVSHTHPLGQTVIVTACSARAQRDGGQSEQL